MSRINCRFCQVSDDITKGFIDNLWDRPLFETDNFFVVPSLGALVEGWLLIVTKKHHLCMGALKPEQLNELDELSKHIKNIVESCYGKVAIFEHGPAIEKLAVGCGVDHAHLHIVPTKALLAEQSTIFTDQTFEWKKVQGITAARDHYLVRKSYLYVEQETVGALICEGSEIPSQLFRKTIASHLNILPQYNWRDFPQYSNVTKTVKNLEPYFRHLTSKEASETGGKKSGEAYKSSVFESVR